jgi:hypothetical protein
MNYLPRQALINWVPWASLFSPSPIPGLLLHSFEYWYTLGLFRLHHHNANIDVKEYTARVVSFAQVLEGGEDIKTYEFVKLVVEASDWGYHRQWRDEDILLLAKNRLGISSLEGGLAKLGLGMGPCTRTLQAGG